MCISCSVQILIGAALTKIKWKKTTKRSVSLHRPWVICLSFDSSIPTAGCVLQGFKARLKPPIWPVRLSSCSYSLYNVTCSAPSCPLSCKNTAFFTTWHWHGPKGDWRTLSVISYHPLFPLPSSSPVRFGGSWWSGSRARNKVVVSTLLRWSALLLPTPKGVRWHQERRS